MLGFIEFDADEGGMRLERASRLGGTFLVLNMGRFARGMLASRRAKRMAQRMREHGVRRAVFPLDFPFTAIFMRCGILPVDPMPLRRALCAAHVRRRLDAMGMTGEQAVVAVSGDYVSSSLEQTVMDLVRMYRYVLLSVPSGGEELAQRLRRECGAALVVSCVPEQLDRADALVLFAPRPDLRMENPVLCTLCADGRNGADVPLSLGAELSAQVAPNCSQEQLAAALYTLGVLPAQRFLGENTC